MSTVRLQPGDEWTTYRQADGEPVWGEFGWVADLEYFDDYEPTKLVAETWVLKSRAEIVYPEPAENDEDE